MNVEVNDKVKMGDVLFQLDDRDLQVQRMNAAAKRSVAQANVAVLWKARLKRSTRNSPD